MRLLLLSNSTNFGEGYMDWCGEIIADFVRGHEGDLLFVPYAAVGFSYEAYTTRVNQALSAYGLEVNDISLAEDPVKRVKEASCILVGGGNTFHLLKQLQDRGLIEAIRARIGEGVPYVGWSAGSNVASPTICTTNDMPVIEPQSFDALDLVPFQINPHYTEKSIPNHGGETRMQRLQEFIAVRPDMEVLCLPESSYCLVEDGTHSYKGTQPGYLLNDMGVRALMDGSDLLNVKGI